MFFFRLTGFVLLLVGAVMIAFSRELSSWYEGGGAGTPTMSDLGFISGGMMLIFLSLIVLLGTLIVTIVSRKKSPK